VNLQQATPAQLRDWEVDLAKQYDAFKAANLKLDLTRGKPSADQLNLSNTLDGSLNGNYIAPDKTDTRNYGGLDGLPELKTLYSQVLGVKPEETLIGGNSSLTLMHQVLTFAHYFGLRNADQAWNKESTVKFICPVPGYDRHFGICQHLNIEMIPVALNSDGPDMDAVEKLVAADQSIKGMWCVPRFSNPGGEVYSDAVVERIAKLGKIAANNFIVMWDNAYAVHTLENNAQPLASIMEFCRKHGTENSVIQFGSTSKITFAGAGVAFMGASTENLNAFKKHLGYASIGPDKINQLRHLNFIPDRNALSALMEKHAQLLKPRFDIVLKHLHTLAGTGMGNWTTPQGGYFISFDTLPGLAKTVVKLADDAGVKLTPAGATFPYGKDPDDRNIRLAPSFPSLNEIDKAMEGFVICVKLASVRQALAKAA
jgi:DNA-binding transcriptional MocR family regulator